MTIDPPHDTGPCPTLRADSNSCLTKWAESIDPLNDTRPHLTMQADSLDSQPHDSNTVGFAYYIDTS